MKLPHAIDRCINQIPIPITQIGGTSEAAIATPAKDASSFSNLNVRNAIHPEANAIPRSTRVGWVLIRISFVT